MDDLPESFPKALKKIIAWTELNQDTIAEKTKMDRRTLQRLMSGDIQSPSTIIVMRICIGLAIPIEIRDDHAVHESDSYDGSRSEQRPVGDETQMIMILPLRGGSPCDPRV